MIDLTPILQALIALLAGWITLRVIPWIKAKTNAQQQAYLLSTAKIQVYAAEQIYSAGNGDEKFAYVAAELEDRGFKVDTAVIEAAVREMNLLEMWDVTLDVEAIANGGEE